MRIQISRLDTVIRSPDRLQMCSLLVPVETAEFQRLRDEPGVSDSVLSKHVKQLEKSGYVKQKKQAKC